MIYNYRITLRLLLYQILTHNLTFFVIFNILFTCEFQFGRDNDHVYRYFIIYLEVCLLCIHFHLKANICASNMWMREASGKSLRVVYTRYIDIYPSHLHVCTFRVTVNVIFIFLFLEYFWFMNRFLLFFLRKKCRKCVVYVVDVLRKFIICLWKDVLYPVRRHS